MKEYRKPEITMLGDAAHLIQSSKAGKLDSNDPQNEIVHSECTQD